MEGRGARKGTRQAPLPRGPGGLGRQGGREERGFPRDGVGASSCCLPSLCHRKVPRRTGGAQLGGCPNASHGRWPVPITGAFGVPASLVHLGESTPLPANPPRVAVKGHPWPCAFPCPTASLVLLPSAGSFVPGGFLLPFIPRLTGDPGRLRIPAGTPHISGCLGQGLQQGASLPLRPISGFPAYSLSSVSTFLQPAVTGGWRRGVQSTPGCQA